MSRVVEGLKWAGLLTLLAFLLALPITLGVILQSSQPTAKELCRHHRGVRSLEGEGHFLSIETHTVLCRDGYSGEVRVP